MKGRKEVCVFFFQLKKLDFLGEKIVAHPNWTQKIVSKSESLEILQELWIAGKPILPLLPK